MNRDKKSLCLSIVGLTAVGKTSRAMEAADQLLKEKNARGVDIISADSRQVYKGLEILSGADVPEGFEAVLLRQAQHDSLTSQHDSLTSQHDRLQQAQSDIASYDSLTAQHDTPNYSNLDGSIRIHGISMIKPNEGWSLAHFVNFAREIMVWSWSNNRQPILVGGTGLYQKHLFSDDDTPQIPQDSAVREKAQKMSVEELQQWLADLDSNKLNQLNESDSENPRRLIRAIEVTRWQEKRENSSLSEKQLSGSSIVWSQVENRVELLSAPLEIIKERIEKRVAQRLASGAVQEVQNLLDLHLPASTPVLTTLGVPEISRYLEGTLSAADCQLLWSLHEFQYAKRQLTWWKKSSIM